jgi:hypothetical protein
MELLLYFDDKFEKDYCYGYYHYCYFLCLFEHSCMQSSVVEVHFRNGLWLHYDS